MTRRKRPQEAAMNAITIDHGSDGPAMMSRPRALEQIALEYRATGPVHAEVTRLTDAHLIDRMHRVAQLTDRQYEAAQRVLTQHEAAGFEPSTVGSYAPRGWLHSHDSDEAEATAITQFRALLGNCTPGHAWLLHSMCLGQHPGVRWLASLASALDAMADRWGIERTRA